MGEYLFHPADDSATYRVLNTDSMHWCGEIFPTKDGKWKSRKGRLFEDQDAAAADNEITDRDDGVVN
jgi:hypothetical protein